MKLGLVTYQMGEAWDVPTLIKNCKEAGFHGVELRTTHAHKVEPSLSKAQREDVRKMFRDGGIEPYGIGTTCEFHSPDPGVVENQVNIALASLQLAADIGCQGIKVRPNDIPEAVPVEKTLEQIGKAFGRVAKAADGMGLKAWMEVHGRKSCHPPYVRKMIDVADHPKALVCWNCNNQDKDENGSIAANFDLLKHKIDLLHIHPLWDEASYPWRDLFKRLKAIGFKSYTSYEGPGSSDPLTVMKYYRGLWQAYAELL